MLVAGAPYEPARLERSIDRLRYGLKVDVQLLLSKTNQGLYSGVSANDLLTLLAETAASMALQHPDYSVLAARIELKKLYKSTPQKFSDAMAQLAAAGVVAPEIAKRAPNFDAHIKHARDDQYTYFGVCTLIKSYLLGIGPSQLVERPQHMLMRVALAVQSDSELVLETYEYMSKRYFVHATPTLFNGGTTKQQFSSCFLKAMDGDSIEDIFRTLGDCAIISKYSGGIGMHVHNIRARGAPINGSGTASGLVPMLRVFNNMSRYVDQGGNKRPGALSVTLEPWHADLLEFLELRKNHGKEEYRARDLFYALWVPDLFMRKVEADEEWFFFSPDSAPGLSDVWGTEFDTLYARYVDEKRYTRHMPAQAVWRAITVAQIETGNPSILYKDSCNRKSNQCNLGTIKSSNLCTEIIEFSSKDETAVCNLASLALPQFVERDGVPSGSYGELNGEPNGHPPGTPPTPSFPKFNFALLHKVTKLITRNLDRVIDLNFYPLETARTSNLRHRPMGIGVQGLADAYAAMGLAFDSEEACALNKQIFETIYHAAIEQSCELAEVHGTYSSYEGSPASQGQLQFDLWGAKPEYFDWAPLRERIAAHGLRNSLVTALMPTASTSQILGCTECFEPLTSNAYSRRVLSGEFQVINPWLVAELEQLGLWTHDVRQQILANHGSVQMLEIPQELKNRFKTVWEIKQRHVIDQCADRGPYVDQSQSMNIYLAAPSHAQLTSMHFYGWRRGLKTGVYYLRSRPASMPIPVTVEVGRSTPLATPVGTRAGTPLANHLLAANGGPSRAEPPQSPALKRIKRESPDSCEFCSS